MSETPNSNANFTQRVSNTKRFWQLLSTALSNALHPPCLVSAAIGVLLAAGAWSLAARVCGLPSNDTTQGIPASLHPISLLQTRETKLDGSFLGTQVARLPSDPVWTVPCSLAMPWVRVFELHRSWRDVLYYALGGASSLIIWSVFGLAICRMAAFRCSGQEEDSTWRETAKFVKRRWSAVAFAPLSTILAIAMTGLPVFAVGWLVRFDVGLFFTACLWGLVLAAGSLMSALAIGLFFGWPLMWAAIAAEDSDFFDAISRSFAYTYQRPLHYLLHATQIVIVGLFVWVLALLFIEVSCHLGLWALAVSGGTERIAVVQQLMYDSTPSTSDTTSNWISSAASVFHLWNYAFRVLGGALSYSFFWSAMTAIYLMLRLETDDTEIDDIVTDSK